MMPLIGESVDFSFFLFKQQFKASIEQFYIFLSCLYQAMQTWERPLSENEIDDFLTKNERKERNTVQNILLDGFYHIF